MHQNNSVPALVKIKAEKHPANQRAKGQKIQSGNMEVIAAEIINSNNNDLKRVCIRLERAGYRNRRAEGQKSGSIDLISCEKNL